MTLVQSQAVSLSSSDLVKMDERKRPASHDHDSSEPPLKRQATTVNGTSKGHVDADMPWKDDLERFQKDAIWRQMQEYKRERSNLEIRLNEMAKNAAYHDEHLMVIDAWFSESEILIITTLFLLSLPGFWPQTLPPLRRI
ncbi:hypothetical protein BDR22DRAFT_538330 [Usnea florida]